MPKKFWIGIVAVVVVALAGVGLFTARSKTTPTAVEFPTVTIGYRDHDMYAPLFVALKKGYFTEQGLKVEAKKFASTNDITNALLAGNVDASLGGVNTFLLFGIEEKSPGAIKMFSTVTESKDKPTTYLVVRKDDTITSVRDLSNKKIGSQLGSSIKIIYNKIVSVNNLTNTTLVQMDPKLELSALEAKQIDAAIVLEPLAAIGTSKNISKVLASGLFDAYLLNDLPIAASAVSESFVAAHPDLTKKLVAATDKAIDYINSQPADLASILSEFTAVDTDVAKRIVILPFQKSSEMNMDKLQELANKLTEEKELKGRVEASAMALK